MKKILSVVLAVVMMFSVSIIAFAEKGSSIELDKEYTVTLKNDTANYTFTAPEDGAYRLSASIKFKEKDFGIASVVVGNEEKIFSSIHLYFMDVSEEEDILDFSNFEDDDIFMAKKDSDLDVSVEIGLPDSEENITFTETTVTFKITRVQDLKEIKIGESYMANGTEYFIFKPTEDGVCDIWSYECPNISVMDTYGNMYYGSIDTDGFPADVPFKYKAGELYGIYVEGSYDKNDKPVDSVFHVVDGKTISPDVIELDDITVIKRTSENVYPEVYPIGSMFNYDRLDVSVGNERIATAEYNPETGSITVYGKHYGKTTLTVTEPISGTTAEVEVEVISRTTNFFRNVFEFIKGIFDFIFGR